MKQIMNVLKKTISMVMLCACINATGHAQSILNKNVSIAVNKQRLDNVLEILSNKGDFYFSYNSSIIKRDSLVTLTAYNKTIRQILGFLFNDNYEFKESGNYIIIRRAPIKLSLITSKAISEDKIYTVSGYVLDDASGEKISDASIYEKRLLASALTNEDGFFKIKLKSRSRTAALTVSKEFYQDTTVIIEPRYNQRITITIMPIQAEESMVTIAPEDYFAPDSLKLRVEKDSSITEYLYVKKDSVKIEKTALGKFLLSSKQKIQSLNLKKFFTERPFQVSFTPGLSTHGKLNPQVINNFSLNVLGGYSGGLNGVEIGGLFNLDKKDVKYFQAAGIFNLTGGSMTGTQFAGISNTVMDSINGWQVAGISNYVKGSVKGWQVAGIHNHANNTVTGVQVAGISNYANKKTEGVQIAGIGNFSRRAMSGVQIAGIFNYAKKMHGVQIGLINVSDSSDGLSIGLINIVRSGYHKISFYTNETMNANVTFKSGNAKLYSILMASANFADTAKIYSYGFGLGHDEIFSKTFSMSTELSSQFLYLGSWNHTNLLNKFALNFNLHINKYIGIFAGPSFNVYYSDQKNAVGGYRNNIPPKNYHTFKIADNTRGWIGWNAGLTIF